jgi:WD40 repeat protein
VQASLRAKALHCVFGSAPSAVVALVPAAGVPLASKLTLTTMSLVVVGALGYGAFHVMEAGRPKDAPTQAKEMAPKSPQSPVAEKPQPRLDRFGDPLPPEAVRRFGTLRFRQAGVRDLAFTPDGKQLVAGAGTAPLAVFDAMTGRKLRTVGKSTPNNFGAFALSPDGKRVACCGFDVFVWDLESGQLIHECKCGRCQSVAFSPDGKKIAVVPEWRAEVIVVEVATGKHLEEWTVKQGWVNNMNVGQYDLRSLVFSPDGKFLAGLLSENKEEKEPFSITQSSTRVCVLDAAKGTLIRIIGSNEVPEKPLTLAFQPGSGRLATGGADDILRFWDVATGKEIQRFLVAKKGDNHARGIFALRFSADGRRCAMKMRNEQETLLVLDAATGKELRRIEGGSTIGPVAVALSSDGALVASGMLYGESCVRIWDVASGIERLADAGHRTAAALSLSSDGRTLISEGEDGLVIHWELRTGKGEVHPSKKRGEVGRFEWSRDWTDWTFRGPRWQLVYKNQTSEVEARSLDGSRLLGKAECPRVVPGGITLSPDSSYLAYSVQDAKAGFPILLWDPEREKEPRRLMGHFGLCQHRLFTHDGKRLIAGISPNNPNHVETIWVWDVATAKVVRKLPTLTGPGQMILTANDRLLITSDAGRVWNLEMGVELTQLKSKGWISGLFLSSDERFLAGVANEGDASSLMVWETASWKPIRSFAQPPSSHSMVFSRDGRSLFVANSDSTILEWDVSGSFGHKTEKPNQDRLIALWQKLAETPDKAYPAAWELLNHPAESVPFLIIKVAPVKPVEEKRVRQLVSRLDSESFAEREEAGRQLLALGEQALPLLRQALKDGTSLEARKRIEEVIESLSRLPTPDQLRLLRAVAVLEWSNRPEAVEHLQRLAGGAPSDLLTRAAKAAWQRLKH